jgi:hypothetical protein
MTLMRYPNRVLDKAPRALVLADRMAAKLEERRPTVHEMEPLIPLYVSGSLELDAVGKRAVADTLDSWWGKLQRMDAPGWEEGEDGPVP